MTDRTSLFSDDDLFLFNEGSHYRLYRKLGAHLGTQGRRKGAFFAVWAPDAESVSVVGDFNAWDEARHRLRPRGQSGIWEGFIPGAQPGMNYKYRIVSRHEGYRVDKADPFAFLAETPPKTASVVWDLAYDWADDAWMAGRRRANGLNAPISIYEVHLGSWMRVPEEGGRFLTYREHAPRLAA
jgi:1,4-alpha-glucan branching enzyme